LIILDSESSQRDFDPFSNKNKFLKNKLNEISRKISYQNENISSQNTPLNKKEENPLKMMKNSLDASKSNVLLSSIGKLTKIKESNKGNPKFNNMMYDESIDMQNKDGWFMRLKSTLGPNESMAYGVEESIKPQKLDESNMMFTLNMHKDFTNRIRKVDVDRQQQIELHKIHEIQGQGATVQEDWLRVKHVEEGYSQNLSEMPALKADM